VNGWKSAFLEKLHEAQAQCARKFEAALDTCVVPVFEELGEFLRNNGFNVTTPLTEPTRRSFKAELAENAYVLLIFHFTGVGEFELRSETFVPGAEPIREKTRWRVADIQTEWAEKQFQDALDRFVDLLAGQKAPDADAALAGV